MGNVHSSLRGQILAPLAPSVWKTQEAKEHETQVMPQVITMTPLSPNLAVGGLLCLGMDQTTDAGVETVDAPFPQPRGRRAGWCSDPWEVVREGLVSTVPSRSLLFSKAIRRFSTWKGPVSHSGGLHASAFALQALPAYLKPSQRPFQVHFLSHAGPANALLRTSACAHAAS